MIEHYDETNGTLEEILSSMKKAGSAGTDRTTDMEELLLRFPVYEYAFGKTEDIPFSDKVIQICRNDCQRYNHCWACPPNAGSIQLNMEKVRSYRNFMIFSTLNEVADSMLFDQCMEAKRPHEELTREFRKVLKSEWNSRFYILSAGCMYCEECACPDAPCRHPEERLMTTESHGIVLLQLVEQMKMGIFSGGNIIPYYSMILFD